MDPIKNIKRVIEMLPISCDCCISFMSDRTIRFAFDGEIGAMIGVNDGIS
jgi:hypothetical protein